MKKWVKVFLVLGTILITLLVVLVGWWKLKVGIGPIDTQSFQSLTIAPTATTPFESTPTTKQFNSDCHDDIPTLDIVDDQYVVATWGTSGDCTDTGPKYSLYGKSRDHYLCSGGSGFGKMSYGCSNPLLRYIFNDIIQNPSKHQVVPLEFE